MKIFSRLLQSRYSSEYIRYHPNTDLLHISHLMFADDVMIFFDGSSSSLYGISETLDDFASWSGLKMNQDKTEILHAGLNPSESTVIASYGFPAGSLPIRYLGLPLMSRKLRISEYAPLIDKISARFTSWAVRSLSFVGRLQLISSIITGTMNFWISTFLLLRGCIKRIESLCSRFLWSGAIEGTFMVRMIWLLFLGNKSLWVAWHKHHHIGNESFWSIREHPRDSGCWKSLLKLRHLAEKFVICSVGNGRTAKFWYDAWIPLGPLINLFGEMGPRSQRLPLNAVVADACSQAGWCLPSPRSDQEVLLHAHLTTVQLSANANVEDVFSWKVNGSPSKTFSAKGTWNMLRCREDEKDWYNAIWFKGATPKHAFFMWTAQLNRLPTRSRLASWGLNIPSSCCLCSAHDETRDHLLFWCGYGGEIWSAVLRRIGVAPFVFQSWTALLSWVKQ
ncbi:uncharacterized protein LOC112081542 [Eutrema salsugineum]|uniref:uncharacterized protein LOC112081542 n=1 Tax=Eutrema salsugineum TaxID=72664 RepID=UPI000CED20DD|nr:uncharacterized protein LOC112081542 [Eutrema salsugineum]